MSAAPMEKRFSGSADNTNKHIIKWEFLRMQVSTTSSREMGGLSYKWIVLIVMIFGLFMSILDSTIVNIAIPRLQTAFGADLNTVQWVLTGYTLAQGVATPLTGFLSDRIGIK